ncbi:hypothetical protein ACTXT7_014268 [Hymenolepis weldensis]
MNISVPLPIRRKAYLISSNSIFKINVAKIPNCSSPKEAVGAFQNNAAHDYNLSSITDLLPNNCHLQKRLTACPSEMVACQICPGSSFAGLPLRFCCGRETNVIAQDRMEMAVKFHGLGALTSWRLEHYVRAPTTATHYGTIANLPTYLYPNLSSLTSERDLKNYK